MSNAVQQRLRRARIPEQGMLALDIPAGLDIDAPESQAKEQEEFALLVAEVEAVQARAADPWQESPYRWIKQLPPARRGTVGQALLVRWLTHCGFSIATGADHTLTVGLHEGASRVQARFSTLWTDGEFVFQNVKPGEYDTLALLAIAPHSAHLWLLPQNVALAHVGENGWLVVPHPHTPAWLHEYGGSLTSALRRLS